ncbi:MarR family EPS-associated transcriptional regulator [Rhodobacteraceae bacterium XHP0102]|nr:MarR family EPS-associated transcriptional regulator [Rhodobacteraceae bacterium XHP0102]
MASLNEIRRQEARLQLLRYVAEHPDASTRDIARHLGISNGSAYYLLKALLDKGLLKAKNFAKAESKAPYLYVLTPEGISQKLTLTERFLERKRQEYRDLRAEIEAMEADLAQGAEEGAR